MAANSTLIRWCAIAALMVGAALGPSRPAAAAPKLFGTSEVRGGKPALFTKWMDMLAHMRATPEPFDDACEGQAAKYCHLKQWNAFLLSLKGRAPRDQLDQVNQFMDKFPYIEDIVNWGIEDYWETPLEFLRKSGDCEDYAIAKYMSLRYLGWPVDALRVVVVRDVNLSTDHAILAVYVDDGILVLDNQIHRVANADNVRQYRPYYSINEDHWWFHH